MVVTENPSAGDTSTPDEEPVDPYVGRVFGGRYKILGLLGEGAFGAVYDGLQLNLDQRVAIKILKPEVSQQEVLVSRFYNEARIYAQIGHPHVVKVHDFGQEESDETLYLVMEFLEGQDLRGILDDHGALPLDRLLLLGSQVVQGLGAAHKLGVVHRDVKPANIMVLEPDSDRPFAKLLDFGISKIADPGAGVESSQMPSDPLAEKFQMGLTRAGKFTGTPTYMSPEQCYGHDLDERSDIYSMGVVLYELACGKAPFSARSLFALLHKHASQPPPAFTERNPNAKVHPELEKIILRCLEKSPQARYQSSEELLEAIEALQAKESGPEVVSLLEMNEEEAQQSKLPVSRRSFGDSDEEELRDIVKRVLGTLAKAYKSYKLYPRDNPVFAQLNDEVLRLLKEFFREQEELELTIDRFAIFYGGKRVYEDPDLRNSYPFKLFSDGIRRLYIRDGLSATELSSYFECLRVVSSRDSLNVDLVTLMWEKRFEHIGYLLVEDLVEDSMPDIDLLAAGFDIKDDSSYRGDKEKKDKGKGKKDPLEEALSPISTEEHNELRRMVTAHMDADHTRTFIQVLFQGLLRAKDDEDTRTVITMLGEVCLSLSANGHIRSIVLLLRGVHALAAKFTDKDLQAALLDVAAIPAQPRRLDQLFQTLRAQGTPELWEEASSMLKLVDPSTVPNIVAHLPSLTESHELPRVQQVLVHLCKDHPERLQVGLDNRDATVVLRVLPVLGQIGGKGATRLVVSTLTHKIPDVRRQAIQTMTRMDGTGLGDRLTKLITDASGVVRLAALEACGSVDPKKSRPAIAAALDVDLFPNRRREEQVLTLQAATRLGGDEVTEALSELLYPESPPWYRSQAGMMGLVALVAAGALALLMWQLSVVWALGIWVAAGVGAWLGGLELVLVEDEETTALVEPAAKALARLGTREAIGALEEAAQNNWGRAQRLCAETAERWEEIHNAYLQRDEGTDDGLIAMNADSREAMDDEEGEA